MEKRPKRPAAHDKPGISTPHEVRQRGDLARVSSERDALLQLVLRNNSSLMGRLGQRWTLLNARHRWAGRILTVPARWLYLVATLRWPGGIRINPLFDEDWYREQYSDVPVGRRAAYQQFRRLSLTEARDANPLFDTDWYLERHPDVRRSRIHPLDHYLLFGWQEGRDPGPHFDGLEYLRTHPDAVMRMTNPLLHQMCGMGPGPGDPSDPLDPTSPRLPGPPRALQRVTTHLRRYGARRTLRRILWELGIDRPVVLDSGRVEPVVAAIEPRHIKAGLDSPREDAVEGTETLLVEGWAFSGAPVVSVDVYVGDRLVVQTTTGRPRSEVGALHRAHAAAPLSGFRAYVSLRGLSVGQHVLQIVVRDAEGSVRVLMRAFERVDPEQHYHRYYVRSLPTPAEAAEVEARVAARHDVVPVRLVIQDGPTEDLERTLRSVGRQGHGALTCVVITPSEDPGLVEQRLAAHALDGVVVSNLLASLPARGDVGERIGFLVAGETLAPGAIARMVLAGERSDAALIYADHDSVDETGRHVQPRLAPDWAPDHLLSQDYVGGFYLAGDLERLREAASSLPDLAEPSWRWVVLLRLIEDAAIAHVPDVLWTRPVGAPTTATCEHEGEAVKDALARRGSRVAVEAVDVGSWGCARRVIWPLPEPPPLVSIIIPTTGRLELVTGILGAIRERTDYRNTELIFLDNSRGRHPDGIAFLRDADITLIERDERFNWARLNNAGARSARGELLLFLNDDMAVTDPAWLTALVRQGCRSDVGAVGPLMTYPDGRIQHAGVFVVGYGGGAMHLFHGMDPDSDLYLGLHRVTREVSAITGACMLVSREAFDEVGGFDESLLIAGNDVDFCLRIWRAGQRVLFEPASVLVHEESRSRTGIDHSADEGRMWARWSDVFEAGDPYHNRNLADDRLDGGLDWERVAGRSDAITLADPASGVNLVGCIRAEMGVGEAVRSEARALTAADVPFAILDDSTGTRARLDELSWVHKIVNEPVFVRNLLHINADLLPQALGNLPRGLRAGRHNIGFWTWELPEFPAEWRGSFALVDEVWVPSRFVQAAIGDDATVPVHVVPHAVRTPRGPFLGREHFGLPDGAVQFLAMYDTQSVMERKNPDAVVKAFQQAFPGPSASVSLVIKVNTAGDRELARLRRLSDDRPDVHLVSQPLSRHQTDSLMASSDVFVSLHRSEGFGLPIAEAMTLSTPVIATAWSGNMDFMVDGAAAAVGYDLTTLAHSYGPYRAGQQWAEPRLDDAVDHMRALAADERLRADMGAAGRRSIEATCSPAVVGHRIRSLLGL